jgi:hypothetical protein
VSQIFTKKCKGRCGLDKPVTEFYKTGHWGQGKEAYKNKCKECMGEESREKRLIIYG